MRGASRRHRSCPLPSIGRSDARLWERTQISQGYRDGSGGAPVPALGLHRLRGAVTVPPSGRLARRARPPRVLHDRGGDGIECSDRRIPALCRESGPAHLSRGKHCPSPLRRWRFAPRARAARAHSLGSVAARSVRARRRAGSALTGPGPAGPRVTAARVIEGRARRKTTTMTRTTGAIQPSTRPRRPPGGGPTVDPCSPCGGRPGSQRRLERPPDAARPGDRALEGHQRAPRRR